MGKKTLKDTLNASLDSALGNGLKRQPPPASRFDDLLNRYGADAQPTTPTNVQTVTALDVQSDSKTDVQIPTADTGTSSISTASNVQTSAAKQMDAQASDITDVRPLSQLDVQASKSLETGRSKVRRTIWLNPELDREFQHFQIDRGLNYSQFIELAGRSLIDSVNAHSGNRVNAKAPHDDLKIYQVNEDIIIMYQTLTGNRWKPADDRAGLQFNNTDRRIVEVGMLQTLLNARGKKINSFAYFVPEIQTILDLHVSLAMIDGVLNRRREQWQQLKSKP